MTAGSTTPGRRIFAIRTDEDGKKWYDWPQAGDYWLEENTGDWMACTPGAPSGVWGSLCDHQVTEHEDGTVTVSPSILISGDGYTWHGYLERGTWREV